MKNKRPNVALVVLDTLRQDKLSCYGCERNLTPNLDRFADRSTVYTRAVANSPWTLPSHASFFTGKYPSQHGATQLTPYLEEEHETLAQILKTEGYSTACFTCNSWVTQYTGLNRGFDHYQNFFGSLPDADFLSGIWRKIMDSRFRSWGDKIVSWGNKIYEKMINKENNKQWTPEAIDSALDFLQDNDEPYFLFLNLMDPHLPYNPPKKYWQSFMGDLKPQDLCQNSKEFNSNSKDIDDHQLDLLSRLYEAEVRYMDVQLKELLTVLEDSNTLVIITSDHGENLGEHQLLGHEFCIYDTLLKVPLLVSYPEESSGGRGEGKQKEIKSPVDLRQLFPTILAAAGIESSSYQGATDQLPNQDRHQSQKRPIYSEYFRPKIELTQMRQIDPQFSDPEVETNMKAVRSDSWKYIWYEKEEATDKLFNLEQDPQERTNLLEQHPEKAEQLRRMLAEKFDQANLAAKDANQVLDSMDQAVKGRLEELGYL